MYEKLDKLRAELDRAKQRRADADAKVKQLEQKLREAENSQILADVGALKLTPEQLAQFLQLAASGQLPATQSNPVVSATPVSATEENDDYEESEDFDDEEI
ncbi:MAG: DUF4315 family protein [Lachnospiraceae bacterium]|nr:DUF4315 family protein [Lachnospiraceae bacterium]